MRQYITLDRFLDPCAPHEDLIHSPSCLIALRLRFLFVSRFQFSIYFSPPFSAHRAPAAQFAQIRQLNLQFLFLQQHIDSEGRYLSSFQYLCFSFENPLPLLRPAEKVQHQKTLRRRSMQRHVLILIIAVLHVIYRINREQQKLKEKSIFRSALTT